MSSIKPPIVIDESSDIDVFDSVAHAESYLEPIDVKNNLFVAYDSEGKLLRPLPTSPTITIDSAESEPNHLNELREVLIKFITQMSIPVEQLRKSTTQELVQKALQYKVRQ